MHTEGDIFKHELMPVPLALATTNGALHTPNKSLLADEMTKNIEMPRTITVDGPTCLVIDGQALVMALSKPHITTFGEYAKVFM